MFRNDPPPSDEKTAEGDTFFFFFTWNWSFPAGETRKSEMLLQRTGAEKVRCTFLQQGLSGPKVLSVRSDSVLPPHCVTERYATARRGVAGRWVRVFHKHFPFFFFFLLLRHLSRKVPALLSADRQTCGGGGFLKRVTRYINNIKLRAT